MERPPRFAEEKIKFFNKYQPYYQLTNTFYCGSACRKTDQGLKSAPTLIKLQKADSLLDKKGKNIFLPSYQGNWKTSEQLFQALKYNKEEIIEEIRDYTGSLSKIYEISKKYKQSLRVDWKGHKRIIMLWVNDKKFSQNPELKKILIETGFAQLIENSRQDDYWGIGKSLDGKNKLGKILMVLRASYRIKERLKNDKELNQVFKEELIKRTPKIMGNSHQPEVYLFKIFNSPKKNEWESAYLQSVETGLIELIETIEKRSQNKIKKNFFKEVTNLQNISSFNLRLKIPLSSIVFIIINCYSYFSILSLKRGPHCLRKLERVRKKIKNTNWS